ncbi:MAG: hypothetical protein HRU25_08005 [Psychrobium sp.]|nr:hypothetical protein [Psychrobium sp.]
MNVIDMLISGEQNGVSLKYVAYMPSGAGNQPPPNVIVIGGGGGDGQEPNGSDNQNGISGDFITLVLVAFIVFVIFRKRK